MNSSGGTSTTKTGRNPPSSTSASIKSKSEGETEKGKTRRGGDKGTRGQKSLQRNVSLTPCLLVSLSPCLLVSLSPCLLVPPSLRFLRPPVAFPLARLKS